MLKEHNDQIVKVLKNEKASTSRKEDKKKLQRAIKTKNRKNNRKILREENRNEDEHTNLAKCPRKAQRMKTSEHLQIHK